MSKENQQSQTFYTQLKLRPRTSFSRKSTNKNTSIKLNPEIDPITKVKTYQQSLKILESQYRSLLSRLNQSKKNIHKNYKQSQKKKVLFFNLYENKKIKLQNQKLLQEKQDKTKQYQQQLKQRAKSLKLNNQIRSLLIKNQLQDSNNLTCLKNKREKHETRQRIRKSSKKSIQQAQQSFMKVRYNEKQLINRRKKISQLQNSIARQNYMKKLSAQLSIIQKYDKLINEVNPQNLCNNCEQSFTMPLFLTNKDI